MITKFLLSLESRSSFFILLLGALIGLGFFISALIWEFLGAQPCSFCLIERRLFLLGGVICMLGLNFRKFWYPYVSAATALVWSFLSIVLIRHVGVQYKWFSLPQTCKAKIPWGNVDAMARFLSTKPQATCDQIEFTFLGLAPTVYLLIIGLGLFFVFGWGFFKEKDQDA